MTPEIQMRLADFERRHKPDSRSHLELFRKEVLYLHFKGYPLKSTFLYLQEQGVGCSLRTFERWVKDCIDFREEVHPAEKMRVPPWPAETAGAQRQALAGLALCVGGPVFLVVAAMRQPD